VKYSKTRHCFKHSIYCTLVPVYNNNNYYYYYYYIRFMAFFQDNLGKPATER